MNLLEYLEQSYREELQALGWTLTKEPGGNQWQPPSETRQLTEREAFNWLMRFTAQK